MNIKHRLILTLCCIQSVVLSSQITLESSYSFAKPLGIFAEHINRDAIFGIQVGGMYALTTNPEVSIGMHYEYLPYDEATLSDLKLERGAYIRQEFKTNAFLQRISAVGRYHLTSNNAWFRPYIDGILGLNWFRGVTYSEDAYFTADTNKDGRINTLDGPIDYEDNQIILEKQAKTTNLSSVNALAGISLGTKVRIIGNLSFDTKVSYVHGFEASYFDHGSLDITGKSPASSFAKVHSTVSTLQWNNGLSYSF